MLSLVDLEDGSKTEFPLYGDPGMYGDPGRRRWGTNPTGSIVASASQDGSVQVWSVTEQKPHLLLGYEGPVGEPVISPDGKWVATSRDGVIRLWPMPDLSAPPFHTLPLGELLTKLKSLTNVRAVPDEEFSTGYRIAPDFTAYRGWAEVPEW